MPCQATMWKKSNEYKYVYELKVNLPILVYTCNSADR